jgi:hypothetical protein
MPLSILEFDEDVRTNLRRQQGLQSRTVNDAAQGHETAGHQAVFVQRLQN